MLLGARQSLWNKSSKIQVFGWREHVKSNYHSNILNFNTHAMTIMFWINRSSYSGVNDEYLGVLNGTTSNTYGVSIATYNDGELVGCNQNISMMETSYYMQPNVWTHIAITRSENGRNLKIYANGQQVYSNTFSAQRGLPNNIAFPWNKNCGSSKFAKFLIYDKEFTQNDISNEINNISNLQYEDKLRAAFVLGVQNNILIDSCGNYNINVQNDIINFEKFN